jgi:hypothetical protein
MLSQGRAWGQAVRAKMELESKQQVNVYSRAKLSK